MQKEVSFGIIPVRFFHHQWQLLLVKHGKGHWAFPKGHAEENEAPQETAIRELKEECGLEVESFFETPPIEESYNFTWNRKIISKKVIYFVALVKGKTIIQPDEISDFRWVGLEESIQLATFPETKKICYIMKSILK